jgi:anti-sigma factor RsiW
MTMEHVSFERLCDLADGVLPPDDSAAVERHLGSCAACQDALARLRGLLDRASSLSSEIEPPPESWSGIRNRLPFTVLGTNRPRPHFPASWVMRAAAAVLLVAASSTITVLALRSREPSRPSSPATYPTIVVATPATLRAVDDSYADVVDELTTTLRSQRASLSPTTVATLERTLRIIDEAIAEARAALAADPANAVLLDVLLGNYEQKVQLLRRASELVART